MGRYVLHETIPLALALLARFEVYRFQAYHLVDVYVLIWMFLLGAVVGSLLNVCIFRLPTGRSVVWPGSRCTVCLQPIRWYDNIPILSWFILRGRCRHCDSPFSVRYALIELACAAMFAVCYYGICIAGWRNDFTQPGAMLYVFYVFQMILVSLLLVATFIDFDWQVIPDAVSVNGMVVGLLACLVFPCLQTRPIEWPAPVWLQTHPHIQGLATSLWGLVVGGGLVWLTRLLGSAAFRKEAMGFGDVMLMAMIGSFVGWQSCVIIFFLAPFMGLAVGVFQLVFRRGHVIPYGPYLSLASVVTTLGMKLVWPHFERVLAVGGWLCRRLWLWGLANPVGGLIVLAVCLLAGYGLARVQPKMDDEG